MKTNLTFFTLFIALTLGVSSHLKAQDTHVITLRVNTANITKETVNQNSNFGQNPSISNEDFTIEVRLGDWVEWDGISTSSENDTVEIVSINHEGGARIFDSNVLNGSNGIVRGRVSTGRQGDTEKYTIKFRIYRNGVRINTIFKIDPKLVIKQ